MLKDSEKYYEDNATNRGPVTGNSAEKEFYKYFHLLGYFILSFIALDYLVILSSFDLFDSTWKLESIGEIIEKSYLTLLGFILIFLRSPKCSIKRTKLRIISRLSRLSLFLGIIYFLFAPLIIINSLEIFKANKLEVHLYLDSLNDNSVDDLYLNKNQNLDSNKFNFNKNQEQLTIKINSDEELTEGKLQEKLAENKNFILKITFKWLIGTIIAGISFISIWKYTRWARIAIGNIDENEEDYIPFF